MKYVISLLLLLIAYSPSTLLGQSEIDIDTLPQISSSLGDIQKVELSPDSQHIAVMTVNPMNDTAIEVWSVNDPTHAIRVIPDLMIFDDFSWSPNGQYLATRGFRGNSSGTEFGVIVYDVFDEGLLRSDEALFPPTSYIFKEFVYYDDEESPRPDYLPQWSADSRILAINRIDGIYFIDITDCPDRCTRLYLLDIGYVAWFDWQGDIVITLDGDTVKLWDVSEVFD